MRFIRTISDWAYRQAKVRNILLLLLLMLIMNLLVFPYYASRIIPAEGSPILDMRFGFSSDKAYETLEAFGEEGRAAYLEMLMFADVIYPLIYGLFLILLASFFLKRIFKPDYSFRFINLLAIDAVIFDFLENASIARMICMFPQRIDFLAGLASAFNVLKWVMAGLAIALVLVSAVIFVIRRKHMTITDDRLSIID